MSEGPGSNGIEEVVEHRVSDYKKPDIKWWEYALSCLLMAGIGVGMGVVVAIPGPPAKALGVALALACWLGVWLVIERPDLRRR